MRQYFDILKKSPLFFGLSDQEIESMLQCLRGKQAAYKKNESVFLAGSPAGEIGVVLEGRVEVSRSDLFGNRAMLAKLSPGELFGEAFACAEVDTLPVDVVSADQSILLLINYRRILSVCPSACTFHSRFVENMLKILARKNLYLNGKIEVLSARTIRDKLTAYLNAQALKESSRCVTLPFNRQELADYLSVDRSAMSREISAMQRDGLIRVSGRQFWIQD
ncbi:Crp/Fnr family transcriptional regulator [Massiliimalia massiliensis]|jgi:CRP-like cAMP-binding protein|uniref:Crp/Fnr family transcriptional regulator n=1 Tax=Massiliimalia massiliensis TaxID=1852384 RepID=UPI000984D42D|nr:Crp/Fnr family transcriptional regulator [Massiliimalia massiliensis]